MSVLDDAKYVVECERMDEHGHPAVTLARTAKIWEGIFGVPVSSEQVALALIGHKISRMSSPGRHRDTLVDIAGYARVIEMIWERDPCE